MRAKKDAQQQQFQTSLSSLEKQTKEAAAEKDRRVKAGGGGRCKLNPGLQAPPWFQTLILLKRITVLFNLNTCFIKVAL